MVFFRFQEFWPNSDLKSTFGSVPRRPNLSTQVKTLMMAKKILTNQGKPAMVQQPASFLQVAEKVIPGSLLDKKSPFYTRQLAAANFLRNFDPDSWVLMQVLCLF